MVAKLDRFSREVYHVTGYCDRYFFAERTPDLICAESPKASMLEIRIRAVVAQEEREMIGKRTRAALALLRFQPTFHCFCRNTEEWVIENGLERFEPPCLQCADQACLQRGVASNFLMDCCYHISRAWVR